VSSLFGPKAPPVVAPVNPADTQNRVNNALVDQLQSGGTNADNTTSPAAMAGLAAVGGARLPTLTGLNH
jgi:hypothetical protein